MSVEEEVNTLKLEDISLKFKVGCGVLILATFFSVVGMYSNHWALATTDAHGKIQYNGLWEKCADVRIGRGDFECSPFIWSDPQVSHWFRYVQTTEILAFCGLLMMIGIALLYLLNYRISEELKRKLRFVAVCVGFLSGLFILIGCIVFGSLKDVQKPRRMEEATVSLGWSFAFNIIGGLLTLATSVIFAISS